MLDLVSFCFKLHSLHVALFCLALISCCNSSVLHFFHIALFLSCTFLCYILFVLNFSVLDVLHYFLSSTFFVLHSFRVALFSCCTLHAAPIFVLFCFHVIPFVHSFHVAVALIPCCTCSMLHFFDFELVSCCTFLVLFTFRVAFFPYYTFFMLNSFHVALLLLLLYVALIFCCTFSVL